MIGDIVFVHEAFLLLNYADEVDSIAKNGRVGVAPCAGQSYPLQVFQSQSVMTVYVVQTFELL